MKLIGVFLFVSGLLFSNTYVAALEQSVKNESNLSQREHKVSDNSSSSVDCKMQTEDSINRRIKRLTMEQLGLREVDITLTSRWVEDLGADILDIVELVMAMEDEFEIDIPDADAENILNIKDSSTYIYNRLCMH